MSDVTSVTSSQKTIEQIIAEQANKSASTRKTGELGKDDFLKLLITQVQYQDPLDPQTDTDFIAQMAQFSALEQMQNLNSSFSMTMGFGLIGKYVVGQVTNEDTGNTAYVSGVVESVRVKSGKVYAIVDGQEINVDNITDVSDASSASAGARISDYSGLVGMLGSAYVYNSDGKSAALQGIISSLEQKPDGIYAHLDEVDIDPMDLDTATFGGPEGYVQTYAGKKITVKIADGGTGAEVKVTGMLRDGYLDDSGKLRLILDDVTLPVDDIYATEMADLYSSEHVLLQKILQTLQNKWGTERQEEGADDAGETDPDQTETAAESMGGVE